MTIDHYYILSYCHYTFQMGHVDEEERQGAGDRGPSPSHPLSVSPVRVLVTPLTWHCWPQSYPHHISLSLFPKHSLKWVQVLLIYLLEAPPTLHLSPSIGPSPSPQPPSYHNH
jgi:hypothetical protein